MSEAVAYGQTRERRASVTYAQIERAATDILKTGVRPTLQGVRAALGGGSPKTILDGLNRYWRDLGTQIAGQPDTLRRLPAAVADLAEGLWHQALAIAASAAQATTAEAQDVLARLKSQIDLREHTLSKREIELDELLRARERTVRELEEHLRAAISMLSKRDATVAALEKRVAVAQRETEEYRQRLATVVQRAVTRQRRSSTTRIPRSKTTPRMPTRSTRKKPPRKRSAKRR